MSEIQALVERCRTGERRALAELFTLHKALITNVVRKWVREGADAEDILQNIFLRVIHSIRNFRMDADVSTWLFKIAQNECFRYLGKRRREREPIAYPFPDELPDEGPGAQAESLEMRATLSDIVSGLSPERRAVISLYYFAGMDTAEIGRALQLPPNTVYTRLKRARDEIKEVLTRRGFPLGGF